MGDDWLPIGPCWDGCRRPTAEEIEDQLNHEETKRIRLRGADEYMYPEHNCKPRNTARRSPGAIWTCGECGAVWEKSRRFHGWARIR